MQFTTNNKILIAFIAFIAIVVGGGILLNAVWQSAEVKSDQGQNTTEVKSEEDAVSEDAEFDTSDWETYRNEEWGFEFKYPKEWETFRREYDASNMSYWDAHLAVASSKDNILMVDVQSLPDGMITGCSGVMEVPDGMVITITAVKQSAAEINRAEKYQDIIDECKAQSEDGGCTTSMHNINNQEFLVVDSWHTLCDYPTAYAVNEDEGYIISSQWSNQVSRERYGYYSRLFYKMLENIDISDWQIYDTRDTSYKSAVNYPFSFEYPTNWHLDETKGGVELKSPDEEYHIIITPDLENDMYAQDIDKASLAEWAQAFIERPMPATVTKMEVVEEEHKQVKNFEVYTALYNENVVIENNNFTTNDKKITFIKFKSSFFAIFNANEGNYPKEIIDHIIETLEFYPKSSGNNIDN